MSDEGFIKAAGPMRLAYPQTVPRWHGYLGGKPGEDISNTIAFTFRDGGQPNWFHRQMQYLILGIYWRREPPRRLVHHEEEHDERRRRDHKGDHYHRNFGIGH